MAQICRKVPAQPASTFREAIQSFWFAYMVAGDGTGRPDVFLNDFYQADLAAGRITPEQALELIECLMIKLHGEYASSKFNVSSIHTMTLGGQLPDGSDATNELTRLFLQAIRNVRLLRPTIYIRCHENTPEDVLELAVTMLGEGLAEPNFYGDEPIIAGLIRNGFTPEIARDYALSGCTEVVNPGTGNQGAVSGWINLALLADNALRECATAPNPDSECLWRIIERRAEELAEICRVTNCWLDQRDEDVRYQSTILMPVCLEKCKDVVHGGADSYIGQWEGMGLPNAADMIYAAESLAFDRGEENLRSLFESLDRHDPVVLARIRSLPKFGNDHADVDAIGARLIRIVADAFEKRSTPVRSALTLGHLAGGENMHLAYGMVMGPTLDGRAKGQTLADSLAGSQGYTTSGPTAVISSVCRLDHSRLCAGNITTLRLSTTDFATPASRAKVVALIRAFVAMGGSQLQINVADAEILRAAQKNPAAYGGLLVRVAGYSADFTGIGKTLQDEIIARTEGLGDISASSLSKNR
jgi:formate C-acetyltransferase